MPYKPLSACSFRGCPDRAISNGRCGRHQRPNARPRDTRPAAAQRGYGRKWQQIRKEHLKHQPNCVECGRPGSNVDHIISKAKGGTDEPSNLQTLCHSCHSRKTARIDGGYANRRRYYP